MEQLTVQLNTVYTSWVDQQLQNIPNVESLKLSDLQSTLHDLVPSHNFQHPLKITINNSYMAIDVNVRNISELESGEIVKEDVYETYVESLLENLSASQYNALLSDGEIDYDTVELNVSWLKTLIDAIKLD